MSQHDEAAARAAFERSRLPESEWSTFRSGWAAKVTQLYMRSTEEWCETW